MKKNTLFILLLSISAFINAQKTQENLESHSKSKVNFGVKGGYNLSTIKFADEKLDSKSFFYVGGLVEYPLSPSVSLQGELLFTQLGGSYEVNSVQLVGSEVVNMGNVTYKYQFSQLQVPVSVKYGFIPNFSLSAGMNFAFNISSKVKESFISETNHDFEDLKTLNLYPFLGAEYKINKGLFVDARYNFNFFKMTGNDGYPIKSSFLQAGLGYRFK